MLRFILLLLLLSTQMVFAEKWETIRQKNGIIVERVYVPDSTVLKFRGKGLIDASLVEILAVLQDVKRQKRWNKNSYNNKVITKQSDSNIIVYSAAKVPWPFQDRDYVMKINVVVDQKRRHVTILGNNVAHKNAPKVKGLHRIKLMKTKWYLKPLKKYKGKKVWVEFYLHSDPGGNIPNWLINFISKYIPSKTIENIRKITKSKDIDQDFLKKYEHFNNWY